MQVQVTLTLNRVVREIRIITDSIRDRTDPENNENCFEEKVDNISSPACPDDGNDPKTGNQEKSVKSENDRSGTSDRKKITDFTEKENDESDENQTQELEITKMKTVPEKIIFSTDMINDRSDISDSPMSSELLYDGLTLDEWYWNRYGRELEIQAMVLSDVL